MEFKSPNFESGNFIYLFDNCVFHFSNMPEIEDLGCRRKEGKKKLEMLVNAEEDLENLALRGSLCTTQELLVEHYAFIDSITCKIAAYENLLRDMSHKDRRLKNSARKKAEKERSAVEHDIRLLIERLYETKKWMKNVSRILEGTVIKEEELSKEQLKTYRRALGFALCRYENKCNDTSSLGYSLQTDQKIIANMLALSLNHSIAVVSRDRLLLSTFCSAARRILGDDSKVTPHYIKVYLPKRNVFCLYDSNESFLIHPLE